MTDGLILRVFETDEGFSALHKYTLTTNLELRMLLE